MVERGLVELGARADAEDVGAADGVVQGGGVEGLGQADDVGVARGGEQSRRAVVDALQQKHPDLVLRQGKEDLGHGTTLWFAGANVR